MFEFCVVDTHSVEVWDWASSQEEIEQKFFNAVESCQEKIEKYKRLSAKYPDRDYYPKWLREEESRTFKIMTFDEFLDLQRETLLSAPLEEVTEEYFEEQLNVLPPLHHCKRNDVEMFCMSEMFASTYTEQCAYDHITGKYYAKMVDSADSSTWIDLILRNEKENEA